MENYLFISLLICATIVGSFNFGFFLSELNPILDEMGRALNWENKESKVAMLQSILCFIALFGSLMTGKLLAKYGCVKTFLLADLLTIIGSLLVYFSSYETILLGRVLKGVSAGIYAASVPFYLSEYSPKEFSGLVGSMHQLFINVGILSTFVISKCFPLNWKLMLYFPTFTSVLRIIMFQVFFQNCEPSKENTLSNENVGKMELKDLFQPNMMRRLSVGVGINILQQLSGINILVFYSVSIFDYAARNYANHMDQAILFSLLFSLILAISSPFGGFIVDKYGSQKALIYGCIFCSLTLFSFAYHTVHENLTLIVLSSFLFAASFGVSHGIVPWILTAEVLPEIGISVAVSSNFLFGSIIGFAYPFLQKEIGLTNSINIFAMCNLFGAYFAKKVIIDTKGLSKKEINNVYEDDYKRKLKVKEFDFQPIDYQTF